MRFSRPLAAFAFGAVACSLLPHQALWLMSYWPALLAILIVGFIADSRLRPCSVLLLATLLGALLFAAAVNRAELKMLAAECDGQFFELELSVQDMPERQLVRGQSQWRILSRLEGGDLSGCFGTKNPLIKLSYWASSSRAASAVLINQGDRIRAEVKLRRPHSNLNPGGFDYVAWLWRQDIQATGYIKTINDIQSAAEQNQQSTRGRIKQNIDDVLDGHRAHPLLLALLIGDRSGISDDLWTQARETGIAHLLAISGLHLGLLLAAVLLLVGAFFRLVPRVNGWPPALVMAPAVFAAAAYAGIAGWPLSAQRALLMIVVAWLAFAMNWRLPRFLAWIVALVLVLLWQPLAVLDGGFYLSFIAVAILLWAAPEKPPNTWQAKLALALKLQLALLLGLLPLQWWFFGGFSLLSFPLNLLVVPLFALFLMPALLLLGLLLFMAVPGSEALLLLMADLLGNLMLGLEWLHQLSAGSVVGWHIVGRPSGFQMLLLVFAIGLVLLPRALGLRGLGLTGLLVSLMATQADRALMEAGSFRITSFDAGQGTALLVQTHQHQLIYDTGAKWGSGNSAMRSMVLPALSKLGLSDIDKVVISHDDNDHAGGLEHLLEQYPQADVLGADDAPCLKGRRWNWNGVEFELLSPAAGLNNSNNQSCVIRIRSPYGSALLTGDIGQSVERRLLANEDIDVDWLLVPHHGSKSSSLPYFIKAVSADTAVITSGHNNRYGLPAAEVLTRYEQQSPATRLFNTANDGAVSSTFGPECRPCNRTERQQRRWWQR